MERTHLLSIIIVTSPVQSHPDTFLIDSVINSFSYVKGLSECPVLIMMDGFNVSATARTKCGRVTQEMALAYEEYHTRLRSLYCLDPKYQIHRSDKHVGFAMSVKAALEMCQTDYAMIVQHDRSFMSPFSELSALLEVFEKHAHVRYIGFPTSTTVNHEHTIDRYGITSLSEQSAYIELSDDFILKPLMFWYDSTHVCHVQKYLEIYRPFQNTSPEVKTLFGGSKAVKRLVLRDGDFIEDRFGQAQRTILCNLRDNPADTLRAFMWFGSYILSEKRKSTRRALESEVVSELEEPTTREAIIVGHLRGRTFHPKNELFLSCCK